jgi:hypothetical protein
LRSGGFVKRPHSRRAISAERGVLILRRSDCGIKRNSDSPFVLLQEQAKTIMQDPAELLDTGGKKEETK